MYFIIRWATAWRISRRLKRVESSGVSGVILPATFHLPGEQCLIAPKSLSLAQSLPRKPLAPAWQARSEKLLSVFMVRTRTLVSGNLDLMIRVWEPDRLRLLKRLQPDEGEDSDL
jgi:hypothetical protein